MMRYTTYVEANDSGYKITLTESVGLDDLPRYEVRICGIDEGAFEAFKDREDAKKCYMRMLDISLDNPYHHQIVAALISWSKEDAYET